MRAGREPSGSFPSALARPFPAGLAGFPAHRSSAFWGRGSSSLELSVSFSVHVRSPARRASPSFGLSTSTRAAGERLPWGLLPLRGLNRQQLWRGFPCLPPGSFPGYPGWNFALSGRPSSTFLTSSTVCSATDPASLFHLAAAFRVSPSGVCSSLRIHSGFRRSFPLLSLGDRACGKYPRQLDCPRLQGFAPRCECGDLRIGLEHACSAPLLDVPFLGSSLLVT